MASVEETVKERDAEYGGFENMASIGQDLKDRVRRTPGWERMEPFQREGLDMILHKIGRLCSGNPNNFDGWHDIQGYAKCVEDRLPKTGASSDSNEADPIPDGFRRGDVVEDDRGGLFVILGTMHEDKVWVQNLNNPQQLPFTSATNLYRLAIVYPSELGQRAAYYLR